MDTRDRVDPRDAGSKFYFPVLWVLAYGDYTSGEIHKACERSYYRNQFKNCLAIGQLHALMYRDLAAHFEQVHVLYLAGNHGRRTPKKDYLGANDNWDYLVAEVARLHCRELGTSTSQIPDAWSANVNINGVGFNVSPWRRCAGNLGIPWYGMVRRQKGLIAWGRGRGTTLPLLLRGPPPCRQHAVGHGRRIAGQRIVGRHRCLRLQLAVRLPRAGPMDSRRQPEARHHLANERQAASREREERPAALPDRRRPRGGATAMKTILWVLLILCSASARRVDISAQLLHAPQRRTGVPIQPPGPLLRPWRSMYQGGYRHQYFQNGSDSMHLFEAWGQPPYYPPPCYYPHW